VSNQFADERLSAYLDGDLDDLETRSFEQELERDPALRAEVEAFQSTVALLRRDGPARAPSDFHLKVLQAVADEPVAVPWWVWLRRPFGLPVEGLLVAAAAALVLWVALPDSGPTLDVGGSDPGAAKLDWAQPEAKPKAEAPAPNSVEPAGTAEASEKATRGTPKGVEKMPTPPPPASKKAVEGSPSDAIATTTKGEATSKPSPAGTADDIPDSRKMVGGHSYRVSTSDPEAQFALQRIAARHQALALGTNGARLGGTEFENAGSLTAVVQIPFDALNAFERDLAALGVVTAELDKELFNAESMQVTVHLQLDGTPEPARRSKDALEESLEAIE
jgi:hypothetical protein